MQRIQQLSTKIKKYDLYIGPTLQYIQKANFLYQVSPWILLITKRTLILINIETQAMITTKIQQNAILYCQYHPTLQIFFLLTQNNTIIILTKQGQIIGRQKMSQLADVKFIVLIQMNRPTQSFIPNYRQDRMIFITSQNCFMATLEIHYKRGYLKTKHLVNLNLKIKNKLQMVLDSPQWIQKIKVFYKQKLIICWCHSQTYVYCFPTTYKEKIQVMYIYRKISRRDNKIMDLVISHRYKYLICAYQLGLIKIYKFDQSRRYVQQLKGHIKQCTALSISQKNDRLLYSGGYDNCIKIWDINQFSQVYSIRLDLIIEQIYLFSDVLGFAIDGHLKRCAIISLNTYLMQPVISQNQTDIVSKLIHVSCNSNWIITLYSTNHIQSFTYQEYPKRQKQMVQFPLQYGYLRNSVEIQPTLFAIGIQKGFSLLKLEASDPATLQKDRQNFELKKLVYNQTLQIQKDSPDKQKGNMLIQWLHQKLLETFMFTIIHDWKMMPSPLIVTCVEFIMNVNLPKWNCQAKYVIIKQKLNKKQRKNFVILGTQQGVIYFIDMKQRQIFHTKVIFHSSNVQIIRRLKPQEGLLDKQNNNENNQIFFFLSIASGNQICIWSLSYDKPPNLYHKIISNKQISCIQAFNQFIAIGQKTGHLVISQTKYNYLEDKINFYVKSNLTTLQGQNHMKNIICIDHTKFKNCDLFLTGDIDSNIKMWLGTMKILILDFKIFGILNSINFAAEKKYKIDLIISQNGQISFLRTSNIPALSNIYEMLDNFQNCFENQIQETTFEQITAVLIQKKTKKLTMMLTKITGIKKNDIEFEDEDKQKNYSPKSPKKSRYTSPKKLEKLLVQKQVQQRYSADEHIIDKSKSFLHSSILKNNHFRIESTKEEKNEEVILTKLPRVHQRSKGGSDFGHYASNIFTDRKKTSLGDFLKGIQSLSQIRQKSFSKYGRKKI